MPTEFDTAVLSHIKKVFSNTVYANTAIVYNVAYSLADEETLGFKLKFPLISIYRPSGFQLVPQQNFSAKRIGYQFKSREPEEDPIAARFLTVNLPYQIDIYAKSQEQLNQLSVQIMKYLNYEPMIKVAQQVKEGIIYEDEYNLSYSNGPNELSEFSNDDRVYHYALVYEIENARLLDFKTNISAIKDVVLDGEGIPIGQVITQETQINIQDDNIDKDAEDILAEVESKSEVFANVYFTKEQE